MAGAGSKDDGETWEHFRNLESLDEAGYIEPEGGDTDVRAIAERSALRGGATNANPPDEVKTRYPRWGGYVHVDYPSTCFTRDGHVLIMYGVYGTGGEEHRSAEGPVRRWRCRQGDPAQATAANEPEPPRRGGRPAGAVAIADTQGWAPGKTGHVHGGLRSPRPGRWAGGVRHPVPVR